MSEFTEVGRLFKAHGVKGELKCSIEVEYLEDVLKQGLIYVSEGSNDIPYFIENIRSSDPFLVKLETVDTKEDAVRLAHKPIRVHTKILSRIIVEESDLEYHFVKGYKVIDTDQGEVGVVDRIEEYPQQEMAFVIKDDNEFLIPLHEAMIKKIDKEASVIHMELPDGLLSVGEEE